ncbi:MAG: hypothetical protein HWQ35_15165 [Nostoc sp. NMS1]|nr:MULTISPECIES: hypothetical protein [unclassified Nostoc]MBN3907846.1 hypothetical protein [Nostoc sp. NMS1]MBN3994042.1 hypothetical protein [Nostoc sp. NMS2]
MSISQYWQLFEPFKNLRASLCDRLSSEKLAYLRKNFEICDRLDLTDKN